MKRHIPYFSFYPADFMNGVRGLTAQEVGVFTMLLCRIYEENGPVEYNQLRLATYCGMREPTFMKVVSRPIDLGKLTLLHGHLSNARAELELIKRTNSLENSSKAGKASTEKRQQKQEKAPAAVQHMFNHTDKNTDTDTDTEAKQQPRAPVQSEGDLTETDRGRLLSAMGADPISGMIGPNRNRLGTAADMEVARGWMALGLSIDKQCTVIAERCAAIRSTNPRWVPGRFKYFIAAMHDLLAALSAPVPGAASKSEQSSRDAKMKRYEKLGRKG